MHALPSWIPGHCLDREESLYYVFGGGGSETRKEKTVWQLDDTTKYVRLGDFDYPKAMVWGDSKKDPNPDPQKRGYIREQAATKISQTRVNEVKPQVKWWAFRIFIEKQLTGKKRFDTENAVKLVVDAFSLDRIQADQSQYSYLALFEDDILTHVRVIVVTGKPASIDHTTVEIFGSLIP
jgi:hypothetical protein